MRKTILLIDDDPDEIELFKDGMQVAGFDFTYYQESDVMKALISLAKIIPHYIMLDYNMPKMNGIECLVKIKAIPHLSHIPVIMYSSMMDDDLIDAAMTAGAAGCIKKPYDMGVLPSLLKPFL